MVRKNFLINPDTLRPRRSRTPHLYIDDVDGHIRHQDLPLLLREEEHHQTVPELARVADQTVDHQEPEQEPANHVLDTSSDALPHLRKQNAKLGLTKLQSTCS